MASSAHASWPAEPRCPKAFREVGRTGLIGSFMARVRIQVCYTGQIQGVGFRYTVRTVAQGFEVVGLVRNLLDGRVEVLAEGDRPELEAFREAIQESGLGSLIRQEVVSWSEAQGGFRGFEIAR